MTGFAEVFLARTAEGQYVAIKKPHPAILLPIEEKMKERFMDEAKKWYKLYLQKDINRGIVGIYSYGSDPEPHIVMEYMDRGSLRMNLRTLTFDEKLNCLLTILDTLYQVHFLGILHRDIKPDNIFRMCTPIPIPAMIMQMVV